MAPLRLEVSAVRGLQGCYQMLDDRSTDVNFNCKQARRDSCIKKTTGVRVRWQEYYIKRQAARGFMFSTLVGIGFFGQSVTSWMHKPQGPPHPTN